jgi:hypothetical protein
VDWRSALTRVRNQLGQAGGVGTAGAQNSITERAVGGWVLDAVDDELSALFALTSPASGERDAPAGYVLVPVEPTEAIVEAMHEVWRQRERERIEIAGPSGQVGRLGWAEEYWRAAVAAAMLAKVKP